MIGTGWFGSGLIGELAHWPRIVPRVIFTRRPEHAAGLLAALGISRRDIRTVATSREAADTSPEHYLISKELDLIHDLPGIDAVFDTTGHLLTGAQAALASIESGKHFITAGAELDSTVGLILSRMAREVGVIYSVCDGDQPGVLARLVREVRAFGFEIVVAGNCKGFLDTHKTPDDILPWVRPGHNPRMVTAFTDGTKQGLELSSLANGFGLKTGKRGMHGPVTQKANLVRDLTGLVSGTGLVDFCLGINGVDQGGGVFVIGRREGERAAADLDYMKKGTGPDYLFFRDHHLCYIEAPRTVEDIVRFGMATLSPREQTTDVAAVAKRDLKAGEALDGIGGYTVYGLIDNADVVAEEALLPVGLAEYAVLKRAVERDTPVTYAMVDFPENNDVLQLRKEQDTFRQTPLVTTPRGKVAGTL